MYNRLIHCIPLTFPCMDYLNLRKWVFITLVNFIRNWEAIGYFDYSELIDFFKSTSSHGSSLGLVQLPDFPKHSLQITSNQT